jgi:arginine exporter protein ArgO
MDAFVTGILAGYGIAIPVGAIAILIIDVGVRCGFRCAFFAGAGAATADLVYAALAVVGGAALSNVVESIETPLQILSGVVLIVIAIVGLAGLRKPIEKIEIPMPDRRELAGTYARFVGLTIINPTTIIYFAAVIVGLGVANDLGAADGAVFVVGAFIASLSWQTLLAGVGSVAGTKLDPRTRTIALIFGNLLILAIAVAILLR